MFLGRSLIEYGEGENLIIKMRRHLDSLISFHVLYIRYLVRKCFATRMVVTRSEADSTGMLSLAACRPFFLQGKDLRAIRYGFIDGFGLLR